MIIVAPKLVRKGFNGITLFPFIILAQADLKCNTTLINHEKIHLRQQAELLVIFFYLWYIGSYFYHLIRLKDKEQAYYQIRFEKEAYANQKNLEYLTHRKFWAFLGY